MGARKSHGCRKSPARLPPGSFHQPRSTLGRGLVPPQGPSLGAVVAQIQTYLPAWGVAEPQCLFPSHPMQQLGDGSVPETPERLVQGFLQRQCRDSGP